MWTKNMEMNLMYYPTLDIEAIIDLWFRIFPDGKASINYALQSPHLNTTDANLNPVQMPTDNQELVLDTLGMAKGNVLIPDMQKVRKEFMWNGYGDVCYNYFIPPQKGSALWSRAISRPPKNISNQNGRSPFRKGTEPTENYCVFCFNNKAEPAFYKSHRCKDEGGLVCCPILRSLVCPFCKATGPTAHTPKYCPFKPIITPAHCEAMEKRNKENKTFMRRANKENISSTIWPLNYPSSNNKKYNIPKKHIHQDMNRRKSMRM